MIEDLYECLEASRTAAEKVLAIQLNYRSILLAGSVYYPDPKNSSELRGENAIHVHRDQAMRGPLGRLRWRLALFWFRECLVAIYRLRVTIDSHSLT